MSTIKQLITKKIIRDQPDFIKEVEYECMMGSVAYGSATEFSDIDIYSFCIPPKEIIFPHLDGKINGFSTNTKCFEQYQKHHLEYNNSEYDINIYNIIKYFKLCMDNNPNMLDSLFVPERCVISETSIGKYVRENRKLFLSLNTYHKFMGYAYSQLHKLKTKQPDGKRKEVVFEHGYDLKYATHLVRLILECQQVLKDHDLDLEMYSPILKSIRRGEWLIQDIYEFFNEKEIILKSLYENSTLRWKPDEEELKKILLNCLEIKFGSLDNIIKKD